MFNRIPVLSKIRGVTMGTRKKSKCYENCYKDRLLKQVKGFNQSWVDAAGYKFHPSGEAKRFPGLTTVAKVDLSSAAFNEIKGVQKKIIKRLRQAKMGDVFSFLEPESFHMTVCDIEPSYFYGEATEVPAATLRTVKKQVKKAFKKIGQPGKIKIKTERLGLKSTIALLVQTDDAQLKKILRIENIIQSKTGVAPRAFCGHITLAYLVREPDDFCELLKILKRVEREMGEITTRKARTGKKG